MTQSTTVNKITVLAVDDEPVVLNLISTILQQNGYTVLQARDGEEGLRTFEQNSAIIGLIVTDMLMPRMNGIDMSQSIRALSPSIPILLVSGFDGPDGQPVRGDLSILRKPFRVSELIRTLEAMVDEVSQAKPMLHRG